MVPNLLAQVTYKITGPGLQPVNSNDAVSKMEKVLSNVFGFLTIIAIVYFAIQIILSGLAFISSQGDAKNMENARKRLTENVIGLFIVIIALGLASLFASLTGLGDNIFDLNEVIKKIGV